MSEIKVGQLCWKKDSDNYRYRQTRNPADQFTFYFVIGETKSSWIVGLLPADERYRVCKKTHIARGYGQDSLQAPQFYFSQEKVDDYIWVQIHHFKLIDALRECNDVTILKQIQQILSPLPGKGT